MRILLCCQQSPHRYPIPAYAFWRDYFVGGLREAGHEPLEVPGVDWARGLLPLSPEECDAWRQQTWNVTVACARRAQRDGGLDLVLTYLYPRQVAADAVAELRSLGVPVVNFFCDNVREFRHLPDEFAAFDLHWVPELKALPLYRARGWRHVHAPMPCWVPPQARALSPREDPVVRFIGGRDPLRAALLADAIRADIPLEIRGAGWRAADAAATPAPALPSATLGQRVEHWRELIARQGAGAAARRLFARFGATEEAFDFAAHVQPSPGDAEYPALLAGCAVALGVNRYPSFRHARSRPDTYSRLRDIEAPMLGACYLTEWTEGLDQLFDLEREIVAYRTAPELVAHARALLADPARRSRLRAAAQKRALAEHTIGRSVAALFAAL